mgnify:CR=1 FL=1
MSEGITEQEARRRNRVWPGFKYWLQARSIDQLEKVDTAELAKLYPLPAEQLAQCVALRLRQCRRALRDGKEPAKLI